MRAKRLFKTSALALSLLAAASCTFAADLAELRGQWSGVWYIGMSSGKARLKLDDTNSGSIIFTNLSDEFGDAEIDIIRLSYDGETLNFSVPSKGSAQFAVSLKNKRDGKVLDGGGKFDGAVAKLVFDKAD